MEKNTDEIDLMFFIEKANQFFKKTVVGIFNGLQFIRRNWIVILVLIAAGIGYGYYVNSNTKPSKETRVLTKINYDAVNNVYLIVDNINSEIVEGTFGINEDAETRKHLKQITSITLTPIVNLKQILEKYDVNDRKLEGLIKNLEFDFDEEGEFTSISETFRSEYEFHYFDITLGSGGSKEDLDYLYNYINNSKILKELGLVGKANMQAKIAGTEGIIKQIDMVLETYRAEEATSGSPGPAAQLYVVDKNFNVAEILKNKVALQHALDDQKKDLVYAGDVIVNVNNPGVYVVSGILDNKMVVYPIIAVFGFFFLAILRNTYFAMKRMAQEA